MKRYLPLLAVLSLMFSAPALADTPDTTGAVTVTAELLSQSQEKWTPATVLAPAVPTPTQVPSTDQVDGGEVVQLVLQAVSSKNWALLACAVVLGTVWLVRRVLPPAGAEEARAGLEAAASKERRKQRTPRVDWAEWLRRTFDFDVFACVGCGGQRSVVAYVKGAFGVRAILEHLGLPTAGARWAPARGPPQAAWC